VCYFGKIQSTLKVGEWGGSISKGQKRKLIQNANDHGRRPRSSFRMLAFFTILSTLFFLMTTYPFSKLHSNLRFPISHCETGLRDYIRMHPRPTSPNKASASYRNVSLLNGSMSSVTKVYLSANGHCERRSRTSQVVTSGQASSGLPGSLLDTQALSLGSPQALIRNAPNVSIARPSQITLSFLKMFFVTLISLGRMSGTWMRRIVSGEDGGRSQLKSTSY